MLVENDERIKMLPMSSVIDNSRFLILPWIQSKNLASRILGACTRRLPGEFEERYGYRPVLLETFVDKTRFAGTAYRAANWIHVGRTVGRGKYDRTHKRDVTFKNVFLRPLHRRYRETLTS